MSDDETIIVIHGGREEVRFCWYQSGRLPNKVVDVQIAEGLESRTFPISYTGLVERVLGKKTHGKETRTDWRRRPLSSQQIVYALEDVEHLLEIWGKQTAFFEQHGRTAWVEAEIQRMLTEVETEL